MVSWSSVVTRVAKFGQLDSSHEKKVAPNARIDRAREILETTTEPVENIGQLTGLGAPVSVRSAFHRRIGISPKEYRAVWRGSSLSATDSARAATSSSA